MFIWERATRTIRLISVGAYAWIPVISGDGRYVTYSTYQSDLVPGDTDGIPDSFIWDRLTGTTSRVTPARTDSHSASMSRDGRYVALSSAASLVPGDDNATTDV